MPQANASHCKAMIHAGSILRFTLVCIANQLFPPSLFKKSEVCFAHVVRKTGNIKYHILTHEVSASRLPQANTSHCEAMLHAGFILLFTLVCNAKQHYSGVCFAHVVRKTGNINSVYTCKSHRAANKNNIRFIFGFLQPHSPEFDTAKTVLHIVYSCRHRECRLCSIRCPWHAARLRPK